MKRHFSCLQFFNWSKYANFLGFLAAYEYILAQAGTACNEALEAIEAPNLVKQRSDIYSTIRGDYCSCSLFTACVVKPHRLVHSDHRSHLVN